MTNFPQALDEVLKEIAQKKNLRVFKETHYETLDRELEWINGNTCHRLSFTYLPQEASVDVTYHIDKFKMFPRLLKWLHNNIPMFPYFAKIDWKTLDKLSSGLNQTEYRKKVEAYLNTQETMLQVDL